MNGRELKEGEVLSCERDRMQALSKQGSVYTTPLMPLLASHHPSPPWVLFFSCFYSLVCVCSTLVKFSIEFILDFTTTLLKEMDPSLLHLATGGRQWPNFVVRMMMARISYRSNYGKEAE